MSGADGAAPRLPARHSTRHGALEVRSVVEADLSGLERLLRFLALPEAGRATFGRPAFRRTLSDPGRMVLGAARDDRLGGTLDLIVVDNVTHGGAPWAAIENVVVDPTERRRGVARAMLDDAVALAAEAGCYKVQLLSDARRPEAHALYESAGFDHPVRGFRRYL
jgi:GNAT superfamily N-acetyltransferase